MEAIIGLGTDVVAVPRIREAIERTPTIVGRLFSSEEQAYAEAGADPFERYAVRFAAKEAVLKSLGLGLGGMPLRDIVVLRAESGMPWLDLRGEALEVAEAHGVARWIVSLSHAGGVALATVIALTDA